ncbi:MAG: M48 family metallopeptidase [Verrucomicrobia bacterium]|nr:M48 family metallopeptidase [Verrucomicrobiota bacterium]
MKNFTTPIGAFLLALVIVGCATVAETGRRQILLINSSEEMKLGMTEFDKLKQSTPVSKDAAASAMVRRVGQRIAAVAPLPEAQWEFVLFDDPKTANAFCLPGGKVGVYSGILPICQSETGLAVVVGHEIAHAVARHGAERMSHGLLAEMGGKVLAEAMKARPEATQKLVMQSYSIGAQVGVLLPYSRSQEYEADHLGMIYMARAGYDPAETVAFWKRFSGTQAQPAGLMGKLQGYLSTHPVNADRIAQLEQLLPKARAEYKSAAR